MTESSRILIFHCHIFKNAGSSFDDSLRRNFGSRFLQHPDKGKWKKGARYFARLLDDNPDLVARQGVCGVGANIARALGSRAEKKVLGP